MDRIKDKGAVVSAAPGMFSSGAGEMHRLVRNFDWSKTSIGAISGWPQSLKTAIDLALASPVPIVVLIGADGTMIYNDAYAAIAAQRHPGLLGSKVLEGWPEVADFNRRVMDVCFRRGETLSFADQRMVLQRHGAPEEFWFNLDYSPIPGEDGRPIGVFALVVETTRKVLTERELRERELELGRVQEIGGVGGLDVDLANGMRNRRSPEYLALHGLGPDAANEKHEDWVKRLHPDDRVQAERHFLDTVASGATDYVSEYRIIRPNDGAERWISVKAEIERNRKGEPVRLVGTHIDITERKRIETALREETHALEILNRAGVTIAAEPNLERMVQAVTDAGVALTGAQFGAFFYNVVSGAGESYLLFSLSGIEREKFAEFPTPRNTKVFARTFKGEGILRSDDITKDERYGHSAPHYGMPKGHPPVRSYLAVPVVSRSGEVIGGLFFGHEKTGVFTERSEGLLAGLAGEVAVAIDNTRLFQTVERELQERRRTETELRDSEERFRLIANSAPVPIWVTKEDRTRAFVNQAYMDFLDLPYEESCAFDWRNALHPEDRDRILKEQVAGEDSGEPFSLEARYRSKGEWRWLRSNSQPRFDASGVLTGFIGVAYDITAAKQAEGRLRDENSALEDEVARQMRERDRTWVLSDDLIAVADGEGYLRSINPAWRRVLGHDDAVLLASPVVNIVHHDDLIQTNHALASLRRGKAVSRFDSRLLTASGGYRWISWTVVPEEGLFYAMGRDITEEKERAEELERAQDQLRQAQKMEAVGQLTGGIAHDFNNLLQGIVGSLDLVQRRVKEGRTAEIGRFVEGAMTSANRAAALTHRLLAFSRRQPLAPTAVSANAVVASMEDLLRRTMGEQIQIELKLDAELGAVFCDKNQLENSLLNLAINARDAMPEGGKLTVETANVDLTDRADAARREVERGRYICIAVSDTGSGMSKNVAKRVFEPFFTTKPIGQGTGLGLSMVYGFVRQSHGSVTIDSAPGEGTTVRVLLPAHDGDAAEAAEPASAQALENSDGEVVLVVEDEAVVRGLIVEVLDDLGYRAIEASDGPAALAILNSNRKIDLLVTDVGLPGLNGRQVADAARAKRPGLKVLFMTGYAESAAFTGANADPAIELITKPFSMDKLAARIREIIER